MEKVKRIVCIVGVVVLICLSILMLISAIFYNQGFENVFKASLYSVVVVPVLIYAFLLMTKVLSRKNED